MKSDPPVMQAMLHLSGPWFFFFNDTATTEIYTLSLHDALPISLRGAPPRRRADAPHDAVPTALHAPAPLERGKQRSEEHTSELQSPCNLVCRLLLAKKKSRHGEMPFVAHSSSARPSVSRCSSSP